MNFIQKLVAKSFFSDNEKYSLFNSVNRLNFNNKSPAQLLGYNDISVYVNKAIERRAEKVSEVVFTLTDSKGKEVENHAILDLLNKPNEFHTGKQFWKLFQKYYDITGVAYIYLKTTKEGEIFNLKSVSRMYLLKPSAVKVIYDETTGAVKSYEYNVGSEMITYKPEEVLTCINPDPQNPTQGASLLKAGVRAIETEIQLAEYQANILANGGKVEGIFKFNGGLTKTQIAEMKESYAEELAGAKKVGRPLFLGGDATYQNLSLNPTELSYLASKKATLNDICILTGVPETMLSSIGDQTFSNADTSLKVFLRETIKPLLVNLVDFLDWRLVPEELTLGFIDPTPEDIDKKIQVINALYATDSATINERREIMGLEPIIDKNADTILISFAKTPLDQIDANSDTPMEEEETETEEVVEKKLKKDHPLKDKAFREAYGKRQATKLDKNEKVFASNLKQYFYEQEVRLKSHLTGIKAYNNLDEIFDPKLETKLAQGMAIPLLKKMMIRSGAETTNLLDYEFGFTMTSALESWLDKKTFKFADEITQTTYKKLNRAFIESSEAEESREQLVRRIGDVYAGFDDTRARTIARTEVHGATQKATIEGNRQAGSAIKIWVAVLDDKTRDSHAFMDGEERPIDMPFTNGQQFAGDDSVAPEEFINCRCQS